MKTVCCHNCPASVSNDEIALNIKLRGMGIGTILCYHCLAEKLGCTSSVLQEKAEFLKSMGCDHFKKNYF